MNKKVNGFTLVELVVVIAILGVLAGLLVPSMLGYVFKAKVSAVNSNARNLSKAAITSLTELDTEGIALSAQNFVWKKDLADGWDNKTNNSAEAAMASKIRKYYNGVEKLDGALCRITTNSVVAVAVENDSMYGAYPNKTQGSQTEAGYVKDLRFNLENANGQERLLDWAENGEIDS